jgi:predicted GNAT family N-acyltransferase
METASTTVQVRNYAGAATSIHAIRHQVFQLEQGVEIELDFDGLDPAAIHFLALSDQTPVGTARIRYLEGQIVKLERLAVLPAFRSRGIGKLIVEAIEGFLANGDSSAIVLHAQVQTIFFYEKLGFKPIGASFWEANIAHIKMQKLLTHSHSVDEITNPIG